MISQLLETTIVELMDSKFEISEFQLGKVPYDILKTEAEQIAGFRVAIAKVNSYQGIPISLHNSDDAVMYCLKLKTK